MNHLLSLYSLLQIIRRSIRNDPDPCRSDPCGSGSRKKSAPDLRVQIRIICRSIRARPYPYPYPSVKPFTTLEGFNVKEGHIALAMSEQVLFSVYKAF